MVKLNLPEFNYKVKKEEGKVWIFDGIRKKFVVLTPEEWVRQHFINYLADHLLYPKSLIRVEGGLKFNAMQKRSDIVVFNRSGAPWMVVECKSFEQRLDHQVVTQVTTYNQTLQANYLVISNGISHLCFEVDWQEKKTRALESLPAYPHPD